MAVGTRSRSKKPAGGDADTPAFGGIAERYRRAGDLDKAVALCREGLKKFPDQISGRVTLGWALLDQGKYDEAQVELEYALKRAPDNLAAIRGLAELHDRAESTMMLPMDGPGQWPPDAAMIEEAAAAAEAPAAEPPAASPPAAKAESQTPEPEWVAAPPVAEPVEEPIAAAPPVAPAAAVETTPPAGVASAGAGYDTTPVAYTRASDHEPAKPGKPAKPAKRATIDIDPPMSEAEIAALSALLQQEEELAAAAEANAPMPMPAPVESAAVETAAIDETPAAIEPAPAEYAPLEHVEHVAPVVDSGPMSHLSAEDLAAELVAASKRPPEQAPELFARAATEEAFSDVPAREVDFSLPAVVEPLMEMPAGITLEPIVEVAEVPEPVAEIHEPIAEIHEPVPEIPEEIPEVHAASEVHQPIPEVQAIAEAHEELPEIQAIAEAPELPEPQPVADVHPIEDIPAAAEVHAAIEMPEPVVLTPEPFVVPEVAEAPVVDVGAIVEMPALEAPRASEVMPEQIEAPEPFEVGELDPPIVIPDAMPVAASSDYVAPDAPDVFDHAASSPEAPDLAAAAMTTPAAFSEPQPEPTFDAYVPSAVEPPAADDGFAERFDELLHAPAASTDAAAFAAREIPEPVEPDEEPVPVQSAQIQPLHWPQDVIAPAPAVGLSNLPPVALAKGEMSSPAKGDVVAIPLPATPSFAGSSSSAKAPERNPEDELAARRMRKMLKRIEMRRVEIRRESVA